MKFRKFMLCAMAVLLIASPVSAAEAKKPSRTAVTQTSKAPAHKATTQKPDQKVAAQAPAKKPAAEPAGKSDSVKESKYAAEGNPEGWWNALWNDAHFSYDVFAKSTLLRGENVPGGGISLGVETDKFRFEGYGQFDYFLKPFAGTGIATMELNAELGVTAAWKFLKFWSFDIWAACDIGYFSQLVDGLPYAPDELVMGFSGLILRPKLMTELKIAKYYGLTLGFYYQMPVYPSYDDYSGLGIMFSIC